VGFPIIMDRSKASRATAESNKALARGSFAVGPKLGLGDYGFYRDSDLRPYLGADPAPIAISSCSTPSG
jgi:hypothetical protein